MFLEGSRSVRLRQVRISGFKSFADLTTIEIPSSIVGIVGPNGCGKSNVIEAVRWALGEGKASDLRCKSMSELIFAGSDQRKQAGRAMVELVFDNSDHTLAGPWGSYNEISVKRVLTRDNTSSYLINNQQVRATDVRDLFMGTGLGANSYAIISQGMVTEFAKDSPEKRREYLEEAAGVSKYKKRRREAESRLTSTRSNLERVSDLQITRRETVRRLEAEAEVARRYQALATERAEAEKLWWFVQWVDSQNSIDTVNSQISQAQAKRDAGTSDLIRVKDEMDAARRLLSDANITVLGRTQAVADVEKEISQVEGNIRSIIERRALMTSQLESYRTMAATRDEEAANQRLRTAKLNRELEEREELIETSDERRAVLEEAIDAASEKAELLKTKSDQATADAARIEKDSTVLSSQIASLARNKEELVARIERFTREARQTEKPDEAAFTQLKEERQELEDELEELVAIREDNQAIADETAQALTDAQNALREKEKAYAKTTARLHALQDLEDKARAHDKLTEWLTKQGLAGFEQLFEKIDVEPQWARALESILRERVSALGVSRLAMAAGFAMVPPPVKLTFYANNLEPQVIDPISGLETLREKITTEALDTGVAAVMDAWLAGVAIASDMKDAMARVGELPAGWRFVTPEGHVVDATSITFWADDDQSGHLARRAEIKLLEETEKDERAALEVLHEKVGGLRLRATQAGEEVRAATVRCDALRGKVGEIAVAVTRLAAAIDAYKRRTAEVGEWLEEARAELEEVQYALESADERFSMLDETLASVQDRAQEARLAWEAAEEHRRLCEQNLNVFGYSQRELEMAIKSLKERIAEARRAETVALSEAEELRAKFENVTAELEELDEAGERDGLEALLTKREEAQAALATAQSELASVDEKVKALEAQRARLEELRTVDENRMAELFSRRQQYEIQLATVKSRLDELDYSETELREKYEIQKPKLSALKSEVERLSRQMAALGAVNHAALEQLVIETEEVARIDREVEDLQQAIQTIEAAIHRIDSETRSLLMDTFNRVNEAFNQKFVQLFKGGHAHLVMNSDDALEAGIEMYANPPGKHNHSIRQLSGGELTLTATALVFAFFTLNPAPFCLLDEVDAPLDEANQERLARLIGSMSTNTQFMMITHHRVTMEHTHQLIGVTMKEPGVSRVVSVDITEASQYIDDNSKALN